MVAAITGNGLGLGNTSLTQLGQSQGGSPTLGQAANSSYVNAATGNLVLQSDDEGLLFDGLPLNVLRTYNSLGQLNGNDGWTYGFSRHVNGLTGTLNTAGSTITRTDDDGSSVVYTYNATLGVYTSTDQSGALDTLSWNATSSTWTWTDAAANQQETYNATGQLTALADTATGARYSFSYSNGQLSQIVAGDGDTLIFGYNTSNQLISVSIQEVPPGQTTAVTRQAVTYGYDSQGRLSTVTTTLGSDTDNTTASYSTTYTYQGTTDLIASVTQSDGTTVSYSYTEDAQGVDQVTGVTTGTGAAAQSVTFTYGTNSTTVTDGLGNATQYQYNAAGELTAVIAPTVNGVSPTTTYTYDANGNLLTSTDPDGNVTSYSYDANGNLLSVEDGAGNTITYTYNANDQVTSKTTYTVPAQGEVGQNGYVAASGAETTYYVYNANDQLAYMVDPLGNVSENDYTTVNGLSELSTSRHYLGATYSTSSNSPSSPPTLAELQAWVQSSAVQNTLSQSTRTDYTYDVRGQLSSQTQYDTVNSSGVGVVDAGTVITTTTYDAQGKLLQTSSETGATFSTLQTTSYAYDGLGRVVSKTDPLGNVTSYVYNDSGNTLTVTQANGLTTTQVRNNAGLLISSTQSGTGETSEVSSELYNADGEQIAAIDALGNVTYTFYNADGEVTGTVDGDGHVTAYSYDADGQAISTTQYATLVSPATLSTWISNGALTSSYPSSLPIPASTINDRTTTSIYNAAGEVVATIDPAGNVTTTAYDGTGNVLSTTRYATPLTATQRSALGNAPTLAALQMDLTTNTANRTTLTIYNADGQVVASVDAAGYVTVTTYNAAGEAVLSTAYATALTASQLSSLGDSPALTAVQADITTSAQDQTTRSYYDADGRAVAQIDADGYLTTTAYNSSNTTTTARYATALTSAQLSALTGTETLATLVGLLGTNTANEQSSATTNADGEVASRTAVDGTVTTYIYNAVGHVLSTTVTPASGQGAARTTSATYDAFGDELTATDAAGATTTYQYNALGQQVEATDADGNSTWSYYDADGKLLYTIQGQPSGSALNALGNVTAYTYNAFGQVASTITYAAPLTLISSGTSSGTSLVPTGATMAQVATAIGALGAVSGDANATTSTTYTLDGQVATVTDGDGYVTASAYDAFGDVIQLQHQLNQPGSALSAADSSLSTYTYDNRGEQLTATDGVGTAVAQTTSATYDAFGRVTSRTDGNGNTVSYSYDNLGRQVSSSQTVQGAVRTTETTYDAFGNVLTETDALGNVTTYSYNVATHTTTLITPGGITTTTVSDAYGDTVSVTDGGGNTTTHTYDADGRLLTTTTPLGEVSSNQYDADGDVIQTTDATGHVVTYTYNASGKVLTQTVDPNGLDLTTTYAYDAQGRTLSVTDPAGSVTTYSYDADGNTLTKVINAGTGQLNLTTTYTYDGDGKTLTVTAGAGTSAAITTQYIYDNLERLSQTIVDPGTGQLNLTTSYSYDADNNLIAATDANGNVTRYVYDQADEKIFTIDPTGAVTQSWYDADGRLTATRGYATVLTASQINALGSTPTIAAVTADVTSSGADSYTQSVYNANGQVVYALGGTGLNVTQYTYDAAGQVTQTRQYAQALSNTDVSQTAAPSAIAALVTASSADIVTTTAHNADGEAVYTINGAGDVTQVTYDAAGRVTQTTAFATPLTSSQLASLGSTPTPAQIAALITTSVNDRTATTSYDNAGRVVYNINAAGAVTQTTYDADGRATSTHAYATALTHAQLASLGATPTLAQIGALVTASANDPVTYNVYNGAGELSYTINPMGYVSETRYDATGKVIETLAYANAVSTASEASALQAGTALSWLSGTVGGTSGSNPDSSAQATLYLYDAAGRRVFTVLQNGTVAQVTGYTYDANGNVLSKAVYGSTLTVSGNQSLSSQFTTASVVNTVAGFTSLHATTMVYDGDNRVLYTIDALGDVTQNSYDGAGRLIETQQYANPIILPSTVNASTIAAAISAAGGSTGERVSSTTYNSQGQVLTSSDALGVNASYTYNALGQKTSYANRDGDTWNYSYDAAGHLVLTQSPPVTVGSYSTSNGLQTISSQYLFTTSTYDAFGDVVTSSQGYGTRATSITGASTTSSTYDTLGHTIHATNALGHSTTTTYNALGEAVVSQDANGNLTYSVYNADGQLTDSVDGNGYITAYNYDAYGNVVASTQYATSLNTSTITSWSAAQPLSAAQLQQGLVTSVNDRTTTTTYNELNQKVQVVQPSINYVLSMGPLIGTTATGSPTTAYTYDAYGNITSTAQLVQGASGSSPAIWETTYTYYDALNRAVMTVSPTGSYTNPQGYVTTTTYTTFGQASSATQYAQAISTSGITAATQPALPGAATQASGANRTTNYTYDAIGRVQTETDAGGYNYTYTSGTLGQLNGTAGYTTASSITSYTYNGENQVLTETVNGATTTTQYDALGRVIDVTAPARQALVSNWQSILESTPADDLTTAALYTSVSPVTSYVYDALGDVVSTMVSSGGLTQQSYAVYNAQGKQTESVDAGGNVHGTTYDNNGNILTTSYLLTPGITVTTTNTYDADNQLLSTATQRSNASTNDSYTQQKYNAFGEVIAKGDGNASGANGGYEVQYAYNNAGQQTSSPNSTTGAMHDYGYDLVGNLVTDSSSLTNGAGTAVTQSTYNLDNQAVVQVTPSTNAVTGENSGTVGTSYDRWGNVVARTDANGNTTTYQYDSQNHLIEETVPVHR
jgi:YD repeat-containing protein